MFSIETINFNNGAYNNNYLNGMKTLIMESAEKADIIINDFEKAYQENLDPNLVIDKILISRNINENDLTESDINRINSKVQKIYKQRRF